jgi:hypothetical protein
MEEWLSGVTQLIDQEEKSDLDHIAKAPGLEDIGDRLEMIVKDIKENQQAVKELIDNQEKENGKDLTSEKQDKKNDI